MSEPSVSVSRDLERWCRQLGELVAADPDAVVDPIDQLAVETAVAHGVMLLASETITDRPVEPSGRPILARDLVITADLVLRALNSHT